MFLKKGEELKEAIKKSIELVNRSNIAMLGTIGNDCFPNVKAMINAKHEGIKEIWFSTNTSSKRISQLKLNKKTCVYFVDFENWEGFGINVYAWDPVDEKNYYIFKAYINHDLVTDTITEYEIQDDEAFNGNYTNGIICQFLEQNNPEKKIELGDTITFELNGITEDYFNFILEVNFESWGHNPMLVIKLYQFPRCL